MSRLVVLPCIAVGQFDDSTFASQAEWSIASGGYDHRYEAVVSRTQVTWKQARAPAEACGGYLATLTSAAEDNFVLIAVSDNPEN